jgi:HEAT repeat protein
LVQALADASPFVRSTTIFALDVAAADPQLVVPRLVEVATRDVEPMVRLAAVEALWRFGIAAASAVPAMAVMLRDPHAVVRRAAALTLHNLGAVAASALPALTTATRDTDGRVRAAAATALTRIQIDQQGGNAASSTNRFTFTASTSGW